MKAKITIEFKEQFIDFIVKEVGLKNTDELKGYMRGLYTNTVDEIDGIKDITVEVKE